MIGTMYFASDVLLDGGNGDDEAVLQLTFPVDLVGFERVPR
jgi:hypothetical protein